MNLASLVISFWFSIETVHTVIDNTGYILKYTFFW